MIEATKTILTAKGTALCMKHFFGYAIRWVVLVASYGFLQLPMAHAAVINVDAPIVAVSPILKVAEPICDVPAPPRSAGLVAALRWDLEQRCRANETEDELNGYHVEYEWDGRRFSTQVSEKPEGNTLPIRLRIN